MKPRHGWGLRIAQGFVLGFMRADSFLHRTQSLTRRSLGSLLARAMRPEELTALSIRLYDLAPGGPAELFDWERDWFQHRLPPPPARILVGAAGSGREVKALLTQGYRVDALEPAPRAAAACAAILRNAGNVCVAKYEELSRAVLEQEPNTAQSVAGQRYDAVLLGWGSLTHVLDPIERRRLLQACSSLTPGGPILASFWAKAPRPTESRLERTGAAVGALIARVRDLDPARSTPSVASPLRFVHAFSRDEIEELGNHADRRVRWEGASGSYPHVTFEPAPATSKPAAPADSSA